MIWNLLPYDYRTNRLYHNTYNLALHNICDKYHLPYWEVGMRTLDQIMNLSFPLPEGPEPSIIFIAYHPNFQEKCGQLIREKCPNAKIVLTGSDTVYYGVEDSVRMKPDLFIDTMSDQVELANKLVPSEHIYWTLSEDVINEISEVPNVVQDLTGICLCQNSPNRNRFFQIVMNTVDENIRWGLQENDPQKIYNLFKRSKICIGISSPSPGFGDHCKPSKKGMRDWLGVSAGCLLIQDDFQPLPIDIFPCYAYGDASDCGILMRYLIDIPDTIRNVFVKEQQDWLRQNTMEIQLERILLKHNLL